MSRRIDSYDDDLIPNIFDKVIGTEASTGETKNYRWKEAFSLLNDIFERTLLVYDYADSSSDLTHLNTGVFTADSDDIGSVTEVKFNRFTKNGDDSTDFMTSLIATLVGSPVVLAFKNNEDLTNYGWFNITTITNNGTHFVFDLAISGTFFNGSFLDTDTYFASTEFGASATGSYTPAEIKSLYESNANTNAYTDAEKTKLEGIEASATADQTASEIEALYEGISDTNKYTDAEKAKLALAEGYNNTTWAALVANGSKAAGQLYNITDAHPTSGIVYGRVTLTSANHFEYTDETTGITSQITIV